MNNPSTLKKDWVLTQEAFDLMLARLDADRESAGRKYEEIRRKLSKFFEWRGCAQAEEYTDRTIDRVARRLVEGAQLPEDKPYLFFHGVAINVLREHWKQREKESAEPLDDLLPAPGLIVNPEETRERDEARFEKERRLECLTECAYQLDREEMELITEYHQGGGVGERMNKERRKELAKRLNIQLNALRIRAYRIRSMLENCIDACAQRRAMK